MGKEGKHRGGIKQFGCSLIVPEHQQQLLFRWRRWERADKPQVDCSLVGSFSVGVCVGVCLLYICAPVCALLHHSLQATHSHTQKELSQRQLVPCSVPSSHTDGLWCDELLIRIRRHHPS